jgi:hypothetical protein
MKNKFWMNACTAGAIIGLGAGLAQARDVGNAQYTYSVPSEGDFEDEVSQHEVKVEGHMPVLSEADAGFNLSIGAFYQLNVWTFDDSNIDDFDLHKIKVPIGASFAASEDVRVNLSLLPGLNSDMEEIDGDDFRLDASAAGTYIYSPTLQFVAGVAYGEEFGDPELYPIGGVIWQATDQLGLRLVFPTPKVTYAASEDLNLFIMGEPTGGEWNVEVNDRDQVDIQQIGFRIGIGAEYQVVEDGWLYAMVGAEGGREISVAENEKAVVDELDQDDNAFFQFGYRVSR